MYVYLWGDVWGCLFFTYISLTLALSVSIQPCFDMMYNHVKKLFSSEALLNLLEKCALMEALVLISNQFKDYNKQKNFLEELMATVAARWTSDEMRQYVHAHAVYTELLTRTACTHAPAHNMHTHTLFTLNCIHPLALYYTLVVLSLCASVCCGTLRCSWTSLVLISWWLKAQNTQRASTGHG